jgi:SET domain-containing protein
MSAPRRTSRKIDPKFAWYRLRIGRSPIHSTGVFALEAIPLGRPVIEYTGKRITLAQASRLDPRQDRYLVKLGQHSLLDGRVGGSGAELVNHCCDPNLVAKRVKGHVLFYSRRSIRAGEELTLWYCYPVKITRIPCHCGSPKCRGTLRYLLR